MYYIGVDLGGTNIAAGIVDENGKILAQDSVPTLAERPIEEIVADMAAVSKKVTADAGLSVSDIKAIGIGCPGSVVNETGTIAYSNNIKMKNVPLAKLLIVLLTLVHRLNIQAIEDNLK